MEGREDESAGKKKAHFNTLTALKGENSGGELISTAANESAFIRRAEPPLEAGPGGESHRPLAWGYHGGEGGGGGNFPKKLVASR